MKTVLVRFQFLLLAMFALQACTLFTGGQPVPKPETVNQSFLLAYALVDSSYQSVSLALQDPTVTMTREQAQDLKDSIDSVRVALDAQRALFDLGQPYDNGVFANTRLALNAIRTALISFGARSN